MKKISLFLVVLMVFSLAGCADEAPVELTNTAVYEDYTLVLGDAERFTDNTGMNMVRVHASYTNNSSEPQYAASCFNVRAFQNDVELEEYTNVNGEDYDLITAIKNGQTIEVSYCFAIKNDSEVEVLVGEPTAEAKTIGRQVYFALETEG